MYPRVAGSNLSLRPPTTELDLIVEPREYMDRAQGPTKDCLLKTFVGPTPDRHHDPHQDQLGTNIPQSHTASTGGHRGPSATVRPTLRSAGKKVDEGWAVGQAAVAHLKFACNAPELAQTSEDNLICLGWLRRLWQSSLWPRRSRPTSTTLRELNAEASSHSPCRRV